MNHEEAFAQHPVGIGHEGRGKKRRRKKDEEVW